MPPPLGSSHLRMARAGAIARLARGIRPDAIIERYHNFGGEAIRSAADLERSRRCSRSTRRSIDYRGSSKALLDRALLVEPMRRWRERLCALADVIVTPNAAILPPGIPADRDPRPRMGRRHRAVPAGRGRPGPVRAAGA